MKVFSFIFCIFLSLAMVTSLNALNCNQIVLPCSDGGPGFENYCVNAGGFPNYRCSCDTPTFSNCDGNTL